MSLLDSDAEELKKRAEANSVKSGRSAKTSGLGVFKALSKYKDVTAKHRAKEVEAKSATPLVEHSRGTSESGDNQVSPHPIKSSAAEPVTDQSGENKPGDNQVKSHPIEDANKDSVVASNRVKDNPIESSSLGVEKVLSAGKLGETSSDSASSQQPQLIAPKVPPAASSSSSANRVKTSSNQTKLGAITSNRVKTNPVAALAESDSIEAMKNSMANLGSSKSGESSPSSSAEVTPSNANQVNSNPVKVHPIESSLAVDKSGDNQVSSHPIKSDTASISSSESGEVKPGDNQVKSHPINLVEHSRGTLHSKVSVEQGSKTPQSSSSRVGELDATASTAEPSTLGKTPYDAQAATPSVSKAGSAGAFSPTAFEQGSRDAEAAADSDVSEKLAQANTISTNRVKPNQVITRLDRQQSGEPKPIFDSESGDKSGDNQVTTRLTLTQFPATGADLIKLSRKQMSVVEYLFSLCSMEADRISPPLSRRDIGEALGINTETLKSALRVLTTENYIGVAAWKAGKTGWTRYILNDKVFFDLMQTKNSHPIRSAITQFKSGDKSGETASRQIDRNINNNLSIKSSSPNSGSGWFMSLDFSALPGSFRPGMVNSAIRRLVEESCDKEQAQDFINRFPQFLASQNGAKLSNPVAFFSSQLKEFAAGSTLVLDYPTAEEVRLEQEWAASVVQAQAQKELIAKARELEASNRAEVEFEAWWATSTHEERLAFNPRPAMMSGADFDETYRLSTKGAFINKWLKDCGVQQK